MAIYHLKHASVGRSTHAAGTAGAHVSYITRTGACRQVLGSDMPIPAAGERGGEARTWLDQQERADRKNARVIDKVTVALPLELNEVQRVELVRAFATEVTQGQVPWLAAVHDQDRDADNPHAHLVLRDRDLQTGKMALRMSQKGSTEMLREKWEHACNAALERAGVNDRIDRRTLKAQGIDREPTKHIGPQALQIEADGRESWKLNALREEQEAAKAMPRNEEHDRIVAVMQRLVDSKPGTEGSSILRKIRSGVSSNAKFTAQNLAELRNQDGTNYWTDPLNIQFGPRTYLEHAERMLKVDEDEAKRHARYEKEREPEPQTAPVRPSEPQTAPVRPSEPQTAPVRPSEPQTAREAGSARRAEEMARHKAAVSVFRDAVGMVANAYVDLREFFETSLRLGKSRNPAGHQEIYQDRYEKAEALYPFTSYASDRAAYHHRELSDLWEKLPDSSWGAARMAERDAKINVRKEREEQTASLRPSPQSKSAPRRDTSHDRDDDFKPS